VLDDPALFWRELAHEFAYYFSGGPGRAQRLLGEGPVQAMNLLEAMLTDGPQAVMKQLEYVPPEPVPVRPPPRTVPPLAVPPEEDRR
jgi:hypothetical protein